MTGPCERAREDVRLDGDDYCATCRWAAESHRPLRVQFITANKRIAELEERLRRSREEEEEAKAHVRRLVTERASIPTPEALADAIVDAANGDEETLWPLITFAEMVADEPLGGMADLPIVKRFLADVIRQAMEKGKGE